ncbi:MAG: TraB/GumN family protein [Prevotella sp.]|nr:TraB/GumN family protein [Prevotella sp.]MBR6456723.1 TraB/GumN family protein [Prevotella sp.]
MKKVLMTALVFALTSMTASAQLLYKISGNGLEKPSYIIGTHHLANVGFVHKINGVTEALTETDQVYGELVWDTMTNTDSLKAVQDAMTLPAGKTIKDYLTPDEFKRLDAFMIAKMGTGMSNPMVASKMGNFTPMALVTQFQLLLFMTKHMGEFDPSSTFDQYFQAQAKKNGLPCGGLETLQKQIEVLYTGKPISRQAEELMCFIDNESFNSQMMEDLTSAFYAQNLETLKQVMDRKLGGKCDSTPEEEAQLIYDRNADWVSKMPTIMASKPTFFAVGAAHLPGDKGVLQLLRNAGYTVEGVK